jgi:hypothetical protein
MVAWPESLFAAVFWVALLQAAKAKGILIIRHNALSFIVAIFY